MRKIRLGHIFNRLLRREIFKDWAQSLAIVAIGAIAMTLFIGLTANAKSLENQVNQMIEVSSMADLYITTDPHSLVSQDDSDLILDKLGPQDYVESRFYTYCSMESRNVMMAISPALPRLSKPYDVVTASDSTPTDYFYVDEVMLWDVFKTDEKNKVLGYNVSLSFDLSSLNIDESLLKITDSFVKENAKNPFRTGSLSFHSTVTGVMKHPENTSKASPMPTLATMSNKRFQKSIVRGLEEAFTPTGVRLIYRLGFYEKLGWGDGNIEGGVNNFPTPNQYLVRVEDKSTIENKKDAIQSSYKNKENNNLYSIQALNETPYMSTLHDEIDQATKLTFVFPVVFFVVAILVILTTLRQSILKRRTEIGTFKALGLTKGEIHLHFLSQTSILVWVACLIGCAIGPVLLPMIMAHKYDILYTLPVRQYYFPTLLIVISIAFFWGISLLVTFLITRQEIALKPVDSMRPKTLKMHHQIIKREFKKETSFALSAKMAGRNILYDPVKSLMVIFGVMGCTALLVCGFGIDDTLNYDVNTDPYVNSFRGCMTTFVTPQSHAKLQDQFERLVDGSNQKIVETYQPYERSSLEIVAGNTTYTSNLFLLGEPMSFSAAKAPFHMMQDVPSDEILLSNKVANALHVDVGDTVKYYVQDAYVEAKISRIYEAFYGNGIIMLADSSLLAKPYEEFTSVWVESYESISNDTLKESLSTLDGVALVDTAGEWKDRVNAIVSSISTMTAAVKIFALLLAAVVIYNLGLLNYRERMREIATLKVLGFHTAEIIVGLFIEALSMTIIGILFGLLVGFPFMKLVLIINQVEIIQYIFMIYPQTYVIASLFSLFITVAVNFLLGYRIKNVKAVESLKSVE